MSNCLLGLKFHASSVLNCLWHRNRKILWKMIKQQNRTFFPFRNPNTRNVFFSWNSNLCDTFVWFPLCWSHAYWIRFRFICYYSGVFLSFVQCSSWLLLLPSEYWWSAIDDILSKFNIFLFRLRARHFNFFF